MSGTLAACVAVMAALCVGVYLYVDVPDQNAEVRQEANVYYWADGSSMVSVGSVHRRNVPLSRVPGPVRDAVLAAENADFYSDSGVSVGGMARAAVNMVRGQETQGGSTITQQYVKNTYLTQDQTLTRKVQELAIALKLDRRMSKDDILQGYLNTSWFGRGAYGIQAASYAYYGVDVSRLNPSQGAFLAALVKGGNEFDPFRGEAQRHRAEKRWAWILDREVERGMMDRSERARYTEFPTPRRQTLATSLGGQNGYLVDLAKRYVKKRTGLTDAELDRGGYQIHTTFEKDAMRRLGRSVEDALRDIRSSRRAKDRHVQVGAASVRPGDGAILAVHGGADALKQFSNNADTAGVPAGGVFKPFVLAAAMQYGVRTHDGGRVLRFLPESYYDATGGFHLGGVPGAADGRGAVPSLSSDVPTLRDALVASAHLTFRRLGADTGLKQVRRLAVDAGMLRATMAPLNEEFPLGTSSPSAIRVATAYATFADGGTRHEPYSVTKVLRKGERIAGFSRPRGSRAMAEFVARQMTSVLRDAARSTTGPGGRYAGMSTGGRETQRVAWFAGYGDDLATAVTLFRAEPGKALLPLAGTGGPGPASAQRLPGRIWTSYMEAMSR
ncbi:transglycosylase domain-containing protein [Streptomyces sp. NPDC007984]|uniref:transglycosylase domain-containing protein n=1 Tax=Streptomyces sp. NPDC007984 TaxID=3364801 RepID=UPI0036E301F6